jgi:thiol-disulfide isomerase/thioredoxin
MQVRTSGPALGAVAPNFPKLPAAGGRSYALDDFATRSLVALLFVATGCPTVRAFEPRLTRLQSDLDSKGLQLLAINSNNPHLSPPDTLAEMKRHAAAAGYNFPYLKDADGAVARAYGAICTPHAFLLDAQRRLVYRGRIEDARDPARVTSRDLEAAISDLLAGRPVAIAETDPFGCSIVW